MDRTITIPFEGADEPLELTYDADRLGEAFGELATGITKRSNTSEILIEVRAVARALRVLVVSWNLVDDEGPIRLTKEGMERTPVYVIYTVARAIVDDAFDASLGEAS